MKFLLLALLGLCVAVSSALAELTHVEDNRGSIRRKAARGIDGQLVKFQEMTGINVVMRFHESSPTETEDAVPGAYMKGVSQQLGLIDDGVLMIYFEDVDEWRMWVGDDLTAHFAGKSGTAAELTESGAMHDAKEAWLEEVFAESEAAWQYWQTVSHGIPQPIERIGFQAEALADGLMARFAPAKFSTPGRDLLAAVQTGDVEAVGKRLLRPPFLEVRDAKGRTPLMVATHDNNVEIAQLLVEAGADVNARDAIEDTPYLYAGAEGRTDILKLTLEHGADLASVNRFKGTALIPAAEKGHLQNVRVLLGTAIDINHVNRPGWTALYEAVMRPRNGSETYRGIVSALLAADVDVTIPDKQGRTPEVRAREVGNDDLADLIAVAKQ